MRGKLEEQTGGGRTFLDADSDGEGGVTQERWSVDGVRDRLNHHVFNRNYQKRESEGGSRSEGERGVERDWGSKRERQNWSERGREGERKVELEREKGGERDEDI